MTAARITAIEPLPADPNTLRVRVEGRTVARLRRADVQQLGLNTGMPWTDELRDRVERAVDANKVRKAALAALGRRALSRGELIERLVRRGHDEQIAQQIADELEADGWLDDAAYARTLAHQIISRKPASTKLVVHKLQAHRIDGDLARRVAREALEDVDPVDAAVDLAKRRMAALQSLPRQTAARRIAGMLTRRGFDEQTVEEALMRTGMLE